MCQSGNLQESDETVELWTWQVPSFKVTDSTTRIDHSRSPYQDSGGVAGYTKRCKILEELLGIGDQYFWCILAPPKGDPQRRSWELYQWNVWHDLAEPNRRLSVLAVPIREFCFRKSIVVIDDDAWDELRTSPEAELTPTKCLDLQKRLRIGLPKNGVPIKWYGPGSVSYAVLLPFPAPTEWVRPTPLRPGPRKWYTRSPKDVSRVPRPPTRSLP
jgi:hypothetical protein